MGGELVGFPLELEAPGCQDLCGNFCGVGHRNGPPWANTNPAKRSKVIHSLAAELRGNSDVIYEPHTKSKTL